MQTSYDPLQWKEDYEADQQRWRIRADTSDTFKRQLYPFSVRLLADSRMYGVKKDTVFAFARTKMAPAMFPIEVLHFNMHGGREYYCFGPSEAEILVPVQADARK